MAVDEAGQDGGLAEVVEVGGGESARQLLAPADADDLPAADGDRAVAHGRGSDGQHPASAVERRHKGRCELRSGIITSHKN